MFARTQRCSWIGFLIFALVVVGDPALAAEAAVSDDAAIASTTAPAQPTSGNNTGNDSSTGTGASQQNAGTSNNNYGCFAQSVENKKQSGERSVCLVAGALAIPFRYQLTGNKDILGGVSGDLFAGVNITLGGFGSITLLGYVGYLPTFSTTTSTAAGSGGGNGTSSSSTPTPASSTNSTGGALDAGIGVALPVMFGTKPSHVGIVAGTDRTGKSNNYAYNGKWYLSVLIGFDF
jgi:hypothetical protein